jgi:poly(A) polymerase/tRNA nucleotidyltransferase (CCA-adding enzyme)
VLLHGLADHLAARGPHVDRQDWQHHLEWTAAMLDAYWGQPPEQKQPLVNGNDLMEELDLQPGKLIGELLREIDEARAAGEIHSRAEALALARRMLEE